MDNRNSFKHSGNTIQRVQTPRYGHYNSIEDRSNMSVHNGKVTTSQYESVQTGQYTKVWSIETRSNMSVHQGIVTTSQ